ncbi:MAG: class I SAM-dependent methyltransferase [Chloroflexi bacterium]|nr:class I SAM-dependent methyltransferase [Chloroflexota bacterium]
MYYRREADNVATAQPPPAEEGVAVYRVVRCAECGLAFVSPRPTAAEVARLYDETYFTAGAFPTNIHSGGTAGHTATLASPRLRRRARQTHQAALRRMAAVWRQQGGLAAQPRLLDVGCGAGYLLDAGRALGWSVQGVELSPYAARQAQETLGLPVVQGDLQSAGLPPGSFDLVVMRELLEHVEEPLALLQEARRVLRPQGLLWVQVPNDLEGLRMRLFRPVWWLIPPLHLTYFTRETLAAMLERAGFGVAAWRTWGSLGRDLWMIWGARWPGLRRREGEPRWADWGKRLLRRSLELACAPLDAWWNWRLAHTELQAFAVPAPR